MAVFEGGALLRRVPPCLPLRGLVLVRAREARREAGRENSLALPRLPGGVPGTESDALRCVRLGSIRRR